MQKILLYYHGDMDGWVSAGIIFKYLIDSGTITSDKDVIFRECQYGTPYYIGDIDANTDVYLVDYSFSPNHMIEIDRIARRFVWIDHHQSAWGMVTLEMTNIEAKFSPYKSASLLTWEYLNPNMPVPKIIDFANDYDLWLNKHRESRQQNQIFHLDYDHPLKIYNAGFFDIVPNIEYKKALYIGDFLVKAQDKRVERIAKRAVIGEFGGIKAIYVNAATDVSEVGAYIQNEFIAEEQIIIILYAAKNNDIRVSMRSTTVDVSKIAVKLDGGGHPGAAAFIIREGVGEMLKRVQEHGDRTREQGLA
jgi:uncharacterized protein